MNKRIILTVTLLLTVFTSSLVAAEYEAPTKPAMILTAEDLNIIDGAINSDFKGLSKADKKNLKAFYLIMLHQLKERKLRCQRA